MLIPRLINQIMEDLPKALAFSDTSPLREDLPLIPYRAIREAVVNALMHRNYRADRTTMVIKYSNRIEIHNPGYSLIAEDKLGELHATQSRNPRIADVLHDLNLAETKGTGIRKIRELMEQANLTLPLFDSDRAKDGFSTSLFTVHFLGQSDIDWLANFKDCDLKDEEVRALVFLRLIGHVDNSLFRSLNPGIDTLEASRALQRLRDLELISSQSKGAGTYYVPGKRMLEADGEACQTSTPNLPDKEHSTLLPVLPPHLVELVAKLGQRATRKETEYAIWKLCGWRALQVTELAVILERNRKYVQNQFLSPMIKQSKLVYTYPDNAAHPQQAYKAVGKSKKK